MADPLNLKEDGLADCTRMFTPGKVGQHISFYCQKLLGGLFCCCNGNWLSGNNKSYCWQQRCYHVSNPSLVLSQESLSLCCCVADGQQWVSQNILVFVVLIKWNLLTACCTYVVIVLCLKYREPMTDIRKIQFPLNRFCLIFRLIKHFGYLMQEFYLV